MRKIILAAGTAAALVVPAVASASVNVDANGVGFVGKGDVQAVFGLNNNVLQTALQKDPQAVKFKFSQATSQSLNQSVTESGTQSGRQTGTQSGTQSGTQAGSQSVSWDVSCTITTGGIKHPVVGHAEGMRFGSRDGSRSVSREVSRDVARDVSRSGSRTGSRAGVINGTIASEIAGDPRKGINQFTGFNLKGVASSLYMTEAAVWNAPAMNDDFKSSGDWQGNWTPNGAWSSDAAYDFTTGYTFGDVEWGGWQSDPKENPADCLRNNGNDIVSDLVDAKTYGTPIDGAITDGAITEGSVADVSTTEGGVVYSGDIAYDGAIEYGTIVRGALKLLASYSGSAFKPLN